MEYISDVDIRIDDAVEYYLNHPQRINSFLNSELTTDDKIELYIFNSVKERLVKVMEDE